MSADLHAGLVGAVKARGETLPRDFRELAAVRSVIFGDAAQSTTRTRRFLVERSFSEFFPPMPERKTAFVIFSVVTFQRGNRENRGSNSRLSGNIRAGKAPLP